MAGKKSIFDLYNEQNPKREETRNDKIVERDPVGEKEKVVQKEETKVETKEETKVETKEEKTEQTTETAPEQKTDAVQNEINGGC